MLYGGQESYLLYHTWYICVWLKILFDIIYIWNNYDIVSLSTIPKGEKYIKLLSGHDSWASVWHLQSIFIVTLSFMNDHIIRQ